MRAAVRGGRAGRLTLLIVLIRFSASWAAAVSWLPCAWMRSSALGIPRPVLKSSDGSHVRRAFTAAVQESAILVHCAVCAVYAVPQGRGAAS